MTVCKKCGHGYESHTYSNKITNEGKKIFKYCVYDITPSDDYVFGKNRVMQNCDCDGFI